MAGVMTTGNFPADIEPLVRKWCLDAEKALDPIYPRIFDVESTSDKFHYDQVFGGLKRAAIKPEGGAFELDDMHQGPQKVYTQATYATGFVVTDEMRRFSKSGIVLKNYSSEMRKSLNDKKEEILADVLDNAFTDASGYDSKALCADDHPLQDGLTMRNELDVAADLSEGSLEQMLIDIKEQMKDHRGKRISVDSRFLIVPRELVFEAQRILKGVNRVSTADNDINAIRSLGLLKEEIMHHDRLDDADAYFIKLDVADGLKVLNSLDIKIDSDNDFDTMNMKFRAVESYAYGWTNFRCLFGTPGAA